MRRPRFPDLRLPAEDPPGLSEAERTKLALLRTMLEAAVPLWIDRLSRRPIDAVVARAGELAGVIAGPAGADVLYRSARAGGTAAAFNALAEGVACLSFAPGGCRVFGLRFEARHPGAVMMLAKR